MVRSKTDRRGLDWILLTTFLSIVFIGWLMLFAVSFDGDTFIFSLDSTIGQQTIWIGVAVVVFIVAFFVDWRVWGSLSLPVFALSVISLVVVLIIGREIKGAHSWFSIFGMSAQPSEFAKFGVALGLSNYLGSANISLENRKDILIALAFFFVPAGLVFLQPDAGTALVFMSFMIVMYRAGLNAGIYLLGLSLAAIFIGSLVWHPRTIAIIILIGAYIFITSSLRNKRQPLYFLGALIPGLIILGQYTNYLFVIGITVFSGLFYFWSGWKEGKLRVLSLASGLIVSAMLLSFGTNWAFNNVLEPHQQDRINVWLNPQKSDPRGALYNIIQSKSAIGSGGFTGKGFLQGTMTKLNYVPEQSTDFIFSTLGEEQGFIGTLSFILLYAFLIFRITLVGERASIPFIRYYAYSVAGLLFVHFFINIGMTMGLMPVIGIPLPFMSKGGSALVAFTLMIAVLLRMDMARHR